MNQRRIWIPATEKEVLESLRPPRHRADGDPGEPFLRRARLRRAAAGYAGRQGGHRARRAKGVA